MAERSDTAPSDRPAIWAVIAFGILAVSMNGYMFAPKLAQTVKGETIFMLFALAGLMAVIGAVILSAALFLGWRAARAAPRGSVKHYFRALQIPIAVVLVTVALSSFLDDQTWTLWAFEAVRACAAVLAGWLVARRGYSIWKCAVAGVLLIVIDHVTVKTVAFALTGEWLAIGGVFISFAMFAFVQMALAAAAGFVATRIPPSNPTAETDAHEAARGSP
jgi:hypothetical protein